MSMLLDVARLREPHLRIDRTEDPSTFAREEAYQLVAPVHLTADVHKTGDTVRLKGAVETTLAIECSRCLEPLTLPVHAAFDVRYHPATEEEAPAVEQAVGEDDLDTATYREGVIDLAEVVREQLYLALPMKPLCRDDCRGLCPECGTNLNTGACSCAPAWEDPRLAPLKALSRKSHDA